MCQNRETEAGRGFENLGSEPRLERLTVVAQPNPHLTYVHTANMCTEVLAEDRINVEGLGTRT